ncbi:MAG: response regulator [Patescibacteria group bacterium]
MNGSQKNKKVLIIEDEVPLLKALTEKLEREGFSVLGAENGAKGLETARREKPDVVLLDLVMPEMTGLDVLKGIRSEGEWGKEAPVVILTNLSAHERLLNQLAEHNPTDFLIKGEVKLEEVVQRVKELAA